MFEEALLKKSGLHERANNSSAGNVHGMDVGQAEGLRQRKVLRSCCMMSHVVSRVLQIRDDHGSAREEIGFKNLCWRLTKTELPRSACGFVGVSSESRAEGVNITLSGGLVMSLKFVVIGL